MFTDSQLFAAYFYSQWVAGGLLVICGIAFLLSLKILKRRIERGLRPFCFLNRIEVLGERGSSSFIVRNRLKAQEKLAISSKK